MQLPSVNETGYTLPIQVKPYLSNTQCGPFDITLTHDLQGRFRNALEKTKKYSLIHTTGHLYFVDGQPYCEILEFYFISTKTENNPTTSVPWKIEKQDSGIDKPKATNSIQKKIATLKASSTKSSQLQTSPTRTKKTTSSRTTKINEIAKTLLTTKRPISTVDDIDTVSEEPRTKKRRYAQSISILVMRVIITTTMMKSKKLLLTRKLKWRKS